MDKIIDNFNNLKGIHSRNLLFFTSWLNVRILWWDIEGATLFEDDPLTKQIFEQTQQ